jgi:predicted ester cyclase
MTTHEKISLIQQQFKEQLWNQRRLTIADEIFTHAFYTDPIPAQPVPSQPRGPEAMKRHIQEWLFTAPDLRMQICEITAGENCVMYWWQFTGRMTGPFYGIPPLHQTFTTTGFTISYFEGDRICLNKTAWDKLDFFQQLGLLPSLPAIMEQARRTALSNTNL